MIVGDINDNDPVFIESVISITVGEGEDLSEVLVQVLADDDDSGVNGQITYSLMNDGGERILCHASTHGMGINSNLICRCI